MPKQSYLQQMTELQKHVGQKVSVEYIDSGHDILHYLTLVDVTPFSDVQFDGFGLPFMGRDAAIRRIVSKDNEILYDNPTIRASYKIRNAKELRKRRERVFVRNVVKEILG